MVSLDSKRREQIQAEASAWLARLERDDVSLHTEAAFQSWLDDSPDHAAAFDRAEALWAALPQAAAAERAANEAPRRKRAVWSLAAAVAILLAITGGYVWTLRPVVYETAHGQNRTVTLRDGSRLTLNTDSSVAVAFTGGSRRMDLRRGEVLFDVAHDPKAPFVVTAGQERIQALGTAFVVRRDSEQTQVTLLRGRVGVSRIADDVAQPQGVLSPGDRATIDTAYRVTFDHPSVTAITAWQRGEIVFNGTSLGEAAAELNRYGAVRIVIRDPVVASMRVSGIFATGNAPEFAAAMAQLNGLKIKRSNDTIELVR